MLLYRGKDYLFNAQKGVWMGYKCLYKGTKLYRQAFYFFEQMRIGFK